MTNDILGVDVDDLGRLIRRAQNADEQLQEAVKADVRWRERNDELTSELGILRACIGQALGLPDEQAQEMPASELADLLDDRLAQLEPLEHPTLDEVRAATILNPPQELPWPEPPADPAPPTATLVAAAQQTMVATTATGRRFKAKVLPGDETPMWWMPGAVEPDDVAFVWESGAVERVWEHVHIDGGESLGCGWRLVDRDVSVTWEQLLTTAAGGMVVEATEIRQAVEATTE